MLQKGASERSVVAIGEIEGVWDVLNGGDASRRHGDRDDIKAGRFVDKPLLKKISLGNPADLGLFSESDGLGWKVGGTRLTGFDFNKDQGSAFFGNYIYFAMPLSVISDKNNIALFLQVRGRQIFTVFAERGAFFRQIPSPREKFCDVQGIGHIGQWPADVPGWDSLYCG